LPFVSSGKKLTISTPTPVTGETVEIVAPNIQKGGKGGANKTHLKRGVFCLLVFLAK